MKALLPVLALALLAGCKTQDRLFPMKVGTYWKYDVQNGLAVFPGTVTVARNVPVEGVMGYELESELGTSRVAWKNGKLIATVLSGMRANPALPLVDGTKTKSTEEWKGRLFTGGKTVPCTAKLSQMPETYNKGTRELKTTKAILAIYLPDREIELTTWYANGIGPLSQVQRSKQGGTVRFDIGMEHLGGPLDYPR
jgi:hypothetical protein